MKKVFSLVIIWISISGYSQNFQEMMKLSASDRDEDDRFGYAVAIDGNYAVVGAYGDDNGPVDPNVGSVYVFEQQGVNNWVEIQKLEASDQFDYDRFGYAVDISGNYIIVGAYREDEDENGNNTLDNAGSAYIFELIGGVWTEVQKIVASDRDSDDEFGWSVAIDGTTAIVGAHIEDHDVNGLNYMYHTGSVYIFDRDGGGVWNETQKIVAADRAPDMNYPNGYSGEDLADQFGGSVDISGDYIIVGAHHHDYGPSGPPSGALWSSGAAYIFERSGGVWSQVQKIQNFDRESWDRFGYAVAVNGNFIAVGAYSEDEEEDGVSNPLTNPGSVYIFERDGGGTWNPYQKIVPNDRSSGDHFGYSIEIRDTLMVIGTHSDDHDETGGNLLTDAGSAYIFENNGGTWAQFQKIDASDRAESDELGIDVGISGYSIIVGAFQQDFNSTGVDSLDDAGAAYIYSNYICVPQAASQTVNICNGDSYSIGSSTYNSSGVYTDILTSSDGCDSTVTTTLTVDPAIINHLYVNVCFGDTYYINGFPYTTSGNYSQLYTASNGCDSTVITHLTIDPQIISEQWVSICYGGSYTIGTSTHTTTGTYTDVVTASNFCDSTIITHLQVELPVDISITQSISMLTANSDGPGYQWFSCETGLPLSGETNQTFYAPAIGTYGVIVNENGCIDTSACVYVPWVVNNTENHQSPVFTLYPNPASGVVNLSWNGTGTATVNVYNSVGQLIYTIQSGNVNLSIEGLEPGMYLVEFKLEEAISTERLIIH